MQNNAIQAATCNHCNRRIALYPVSDKLWQHRTQPDGLGIKCLGAHTREYRQIGPKDAVRCNGEYYRFTLARLNTHTHPPPNYRPRVGKSWRGRWFDLTGIKPPGGLRAPNAPRGSSK